MLETLDSIPWQQLQHAYGDASEVPGWIKDLSSPNKEIRQQAYNHLGSSVYHQGTVYSSTASIVPFFCELLDDEQVVQKIWLLQLLVSIAHGSSYLDVHYRRPEERNTPEFRARLAEEIKWVRAAKEAVSAGYPTYLNLLHTDQPKLRAMAAWTLSCCRSHADEVIPTLKDRLKHEDKQSVRASIMMTLGRLMPAIKETHDYFMHLLKKQKKPMLVITAALAYALLAEEDTPRQVVHTLLESYEQPLEAKAKFAALPFTDVNIDATISRAFCAIGFSIAPLVIPTLIKALPHCDALSSVVLVDNLLYLALEGRTLRKETTIDNLSDMQKEVLIALVKNKHIWESGNMCLTVGHYFPPQNGLEFSMWKREDIARFLKGKSISSNEKDLEQTDQHPSNFHI
ncbi:HEAT repeat domain-containing protein [Dictyobacter formicarum]|uniref:HEAT repeat domain-containing protein n=1 Tax=Dictyobacter formicarum TaxID=2778368 RepID=A0ABQ3VHM4_9CHLR|nr:HEAT repeat domain-containing protein [Dictyobacter formicarum]GHO85685.1 hypothetical protein KSZ_36910 [Dictyobacter formicarum]